MAVIARAVAGRSDKGDRLPLRNGLPFADIQRRIVTVQRVQTIAVTDQNGIAVAAHPAG